MRGYDTRFPDGNAKVRNIKSNDLHDKKFLKLQYNEHRIKYG